VTHTGKWPPPAGQQQSAVPAAGLYSLQVTAVVPNRTTDTRTEITESTVINVS